MKKTILAIAILTSLSQTAKADQETNDPKLYQSAVEVSSNAAAAALAVNGHTNGSVIFLRMCNEIRRLDYSVNDLNRNAKPSTDKVVQYSLAEINGLMVRINNYCTTLTKDPMVPPALIRVEALSKQISEYLFNFETYKKNCGGN